MNADIPADKDVLSFGSAHNPAVWEKHRSLLSDPPGLDAVLQVIRSKAGKVSRGDIFHIVDANSKLAAIAAIVWGFPRGSRPGGDWKSFAHAFEVSSQFVVLLEELRGSLVPGSEGIARLNEIVAGVGYATTTKIAYFSRIVFREGPALILDSNVIKAITAPNSRWTANFPRTRAILGSSNFNSKALTSYGVYIEEAARCAARMGALPHSVELALFREAVRPGSWS
ncbi:hypothetical protein ACQR13_21600 [Bradyrhizobium sp. HKCCYLRH3059]|uniref:8-oxoguanine DNA glycosylase OGG fold protein n=1 Tax=Bradyrhizobium sp. HKCCYLRH3059 TaxID=3420745 RepID=UPI003EC01543